MPTSAPEEGGEQHKTSPDPCGEEPTTTGSASGEGKRPGRPAGAPQGQPEATDGRQAPIRGARGAPRGQNGRSPSPPGNPQHAGPRGHDQAGPSGQGDPAEAEPRADARHREPANDRDSAHEQASPPGQMGSAARQADTGPGTAKGSDAHANPEANPGADAQAKTPVATDGEYPVGAASAPLLTVRTPPEPTRKSTRDAAQPVFPSPAIPTPPPQPKLSQFKNQKAARKPAKPVYPLPDIIRLLDHGAHIVLCAPWGATRTGPQGQPLQDKRPIWRNWQRRRPTIDQILNHIEHRGLIAVIPASLHCAALDIDRGSPIALLASYHPRFVFRSLNQGRLHAWFPTQCQPTNSRTYRCQDPNCPARPGDFNYLPDSPDHCQGQVIGHNAYVILWNTALSDLADALDYERTFPNRLAPHQIGILPLIRPARPVTRNNNKPGKNGQDDVFQNPAWPMTHDLSHIRPGHRNTALFHLIRHPAYSLRRHYTGQNTYPTYLQAIIRMARQARLTIPDRTGFPQKEADDVARSIANWSWIHISPSKSHRRYNHHPELQRQRRACLTRKQHEMKATRQSLTAWHHALGHKPRAIAQTLQVSTRTTQRDLYAINRQELPTPSRRQARRALQAHEQRNKRRQTIKAPTPDRGQTDSLQTRSSTQRPHPPAQQIGMSHNNPPLIYGSMSPILSPPLKFPPPRPP